MKKLSLKEMHTIETEMLREVAAICQRHDLRYYVAYGSLIGAVRHQGPIPWDPDVDILVPQPDFNDFMYWMRKELPDKFYVDHYDSNKNYPALMPRIALKGYSSKLLHLDVFRLVGVPSQGAEQFRQKARSYRSIFLYKKSKASYFVNYSWRRKLFRTWMKLVYLPISSQSVIQSFEKLCTQVDYDGATHVLNINGGYGSKEIMPAAYFGEGILLDYEGFKVRAPNDYKAFLKHFYKDYTQLPPENERLVQATFEIRKLKA